MKNYIRKIKNFIQRGKRGYADEDLWSLDYYIIKLIPHMLSDFMKINTHSYPYKHHSSEEWHATIQSIIDAFRDAEPDNAPLENKYAPEFEKILDEYGINSGKTKEISHKYLEREKEIENWQHNRLETGFQLLLENIYDLWD